jgi:hypothetical protein
MRRRTTITSLLLCLTASCASAPWESGGPDPVDSGLLTYVPESQRAPIEEARAHRGEAQEDLAIARRDLQQAGSRVDLSERDSDALEERLDEAQAQVEHAHEYGTQAEYQTAQDRVESAQRAVSLAHAKTRYYEDIQEYAERVVDMEEQTLELAQARVQLSEAEAISALDRPAAQGVDVAAYREHVRELEDEVAMARIEVRAARERMGLRREFFDDRAQAVPASFRLNDPEPIDEMLSLRLAKGPEWMRDPDDGQASAEVRSDGEEGGEQEPQG